MNQSQALLHYLGVPSGDLPEHGPLVFGLKVPGNKCLHLWELREQTSVKSNILSLLIFTSFKRHPAQDSITHRNIFVFFWLPEMIEGRVSINSQHMFAGVMLLCNVWCSGNISAIPGTWVNELGGIVAAEIKQMFQSWREIYSGIYIILELRVKCR